MNRILAAGFAACSAALAAATVAASAATPDQTLDIDLSSPQPLVQHLNAYRSDAPVHVHVKAPAAREVAVRGTSPDGNPIDILLVGGAGGNFVGDLPLGTTGDWSLTADSVVNGADTRTQPFTITSVDPPSTSTAGMLIALSGASVFGGVGLLAMGRRASARNAAASG